MKLKFLLFSIGFLSTQTQYATKVSQAEIWAESYWTYRIHKRPCTTTFGSLGRFSNHTKILDSLRIESLCFLLQQAPESTDSTTVDDINVLAKIKLQNTHSIDIICVGRFNFYRMGKVYNTTEGLKDFIWKEEWRQRD